MCVHIVNTFFFSFGVRGSFCVINMFSTFWWGTFFMLKLKVISLNNFRRNCCTLNLLFFLEVFMMRYFNRTLSIYTEPFLTFLYMYSIKIFFPVSIWHYSMLILKSKISFPKLSKIHQKLTFSSSFQKRQFWTIFDHIQQSLKRISPHPLIYQSLDRHFV